MKKNQPFIVSLFLAFVLFTASQLQAQWSQNGTNIWSTNLNASVGIGTSTPTAAKLQFANVAGNKICLFSDNATQGSGIGINNANLVAYIPDFPNQHFSLRLNSYNGAEKFIVNRDGTVATGSRVSVGQLGIENGGYSLINFRNGTNVTGGIVRSSLANSDLGDAPLSLQASTISFVNGGGFRLYMNTYGNIGIGTTNPTAKFEVNLLNPSGWSGNLKAARFVSPDNNFFLDLNTYIVSSGNVGYQFSPNGNTGMVITSPGNVGIGTTNPTYKLSVNGTIQAKEIRVETGWADYVFAPGFTLRPLSEVDTYIRQNQHLPDVTSAAEIQKDGLQVGKQMTEMMQKIEEMTLYLIDLKKENDNLRAEVNMLKQSKK
jgi:hypothetical protein